MNTGSEILGKIDFEEPIHKQLRELDEDEFEQLKEDILRRIELLGHLLTVYKTNKAEREGKPVVY